MSVTPKLWALVPAAGIGARVGAPIPKQYLSLAGKTVIEHALQRCLDVPNLAGVMVALHADDQWWHTLPISKDSRVMTTLGGQERADSVLAGLIQLQEFAGPEDWVLVHDAARPCVLTQQIAAMFQALKQHPVGGIMATPAADTLKNVATGRGQITGTLDRSRIWQAQTPQMFRLGQLSKALEKALAEVSVTDESSAMEYAGYEPAVFASRTDNIKVTSPEDLALAEFILQQQTDLNSAQGD